MRSAFSAVPDGNRVVVVGIAPGDTAVPTEITRLVRRGIRVSGSYGARVWTDMAHLIRRTQAGLVAPATHHHAAVPTRRGS
jgi:S-(hydroxymethyl)glutathione dehydrogenase/alcohol dehydrogenase